MQDFPANSAKARAQSEGPRGERPEKIERVTSASRRKRGLGRQFKDTFIGGNARTAFEYMVVEVVIPSIQDTMIDAFQGGIERLIKGDSRPRSRRGINPYAYSDNRPRVNYQGMSTTSQPSSASGRTISRQSRARQNFDDIIIPSFAEAHDVLDRMFEELSRYGVVRVSDLYQMTDIATSHTDTKWGWTSMPGARVVRLRDGRFMLDLPEPQPL